MTPLDTQSMTPLYQQVAQQLEQAVNSGELRYGDKIMSESEMSQHYGVSRVTVRRAVDRLVESGVLSRRQGKGTYVSFPAFMEDIVVKEHSFTVSCLNKNRRPSTKVVSNSVVTVRGELMHKLQLPGPTQMVRLVRIRYVDGAPAIYEEDYFPMKYEMLLGMQLDDRSIFGFLAEEMNIFPRNYIDEFRVQYPSAQQAKYLGIPQEKPLLGVFQWVLDADGNVIYYNDEHIISDSHPFTIRSHIE